MSEPPAISLRSASEADGTLLLELRNDPDVRVASRNTGEVAKDEHARWLAQVLADPDRQLLIAELEGEPCGQIRFDRLEGDRFEISIALKAEFRGRALATPLIGLAVERLRESFPDASVEAHVREGNRSSMAAFRSAGFRSGPAGGRDGFAVLVA